MASVSPEAHVTSVHDLPPILYGSTRSCVTASAASPAAKPMARSAAAFFSSSALALLSSHGMVDSSEGAYSSVSPSRCSTNVGSNCLHTA